MGEEGDSHLGDLVEDRAGVSPAEAVINVKLKEQAEHVPRTLSPAGMRKVIKLCFGMEDDPERPGGGWTVGRRHPRAHSPS